MVRTNTIDYGIDLGTSTSSVAKLEGNYTSVVPNLKDNSMNYTPSAVYIQNKKGKETINVGLKAKNMLLIKPNDAYSEFKLTMGEKKPYHFKQADKDMLPEELSAEVLKSLKGDVSN
ncbi:Hsp70 family protein, partial [Escherichia coli]|nr:Hsp70 family protein [Escherichia coli]